MPVIHARILYKGLILVCVPLVFALVVAAILLYFQHYYGEAVKAEALRKQIIFHASEFWQDSMQMTTGRISGTFLKDFGQKLQPAYKAIEEYQILRQLTAPDSRQLEQLENIIELHHQSSNLCRQLRPYWSDSGGRLGQILALKHNLGIFQHLVKAEVEEGAAIRSFREHELLLSAKAAEKVRLMAWLIQLVAVGAIIGSIVIAYVLFRYFMQGIHRGVRVLMLNIQHFKTGRPLAPAIEGTDELALLDARFHEMAAEVAAAQRMKHAFLTTMSRELRAPINSARATLSRLSGDSPVPMSEEVRELVQDTVITLDRLIGLVNDLLALQAHGKSRMDILPRVCPLAEVIKMSIGSLSAYAAEHDVRIESQDTQAVAYADRDRIVQVLVNLLSNAIKFSPRGSSVVVSAVPVDDQVEVRVKDQGRGIPGHQRDAVFERFEQVAATDATEKGGTGLGLPICKEIVERHGGRIGLESEEGKGSTFWFRLPARPQGEE